MTKKYEFLLACRNEPDNSAFRKRKKEGDIIAIKSYPWQWGRKETCGFLIVPILTDMTDEDVFVLCEQERDEGKQSKIQIGKQIKEKRKFQIPLDVLIAWFPELDFDRVRDKDDHYQPFKENDIIVDMTEKVAIVKDKIKGSFKYGNFKKITE